MVFEMQRTVRNYNLDNARGFGARIDGVELDHLRETVRAVPDYAGLTAESKMTYPGVPVVKGNQMQALREALSRSSANRQAARVAAPMIF